MKYFNNCFTMIFVTRILNFLQSNILTIFCAIFYNELCNKDFEFFTIKYFNNFFLILLTMMFDV